MEKHKMSAIIDLRWFSFVWATSRNGASLKITLHEN